MGGMLADFLPQVVTGGGVVGLIVLGVRLIMTGRLVPRVTHQETRDDRDAWRQAYEGVTKALNDSEAARRVQAEQLDELLVSARATEKIMTSMYETLRRRTGGGR